MNTIEKAFLEDAESEQIFIVHLNKKDVLKCRTDEDFASPVLDRAKRAKYDPDNPAANTIKDDNFCSAEKSNLNSPDSSSDNEDYELEITPEQIFIVEDGNLDGNAAPEGSKLRMWLHNETLALINSIKHHYEDLLHPAKRKNVWNIISEELQSVNIPCTPKECHTKYRNLLRSYNAAKDNTKKRKGLLRFQFFNEVGELLGNNHNTSSSVIDLGLSVTEETNCASSHSPEPLKTNQKRKIIKYENKSFRSEYLQMRLDYMKEKHNFIAREIERREEENKRKELRHKERLKLKYERINLEKQKLALLQQLVNKS